ncbi:MAG: aldo/keto reductase [Spirochaetaceae bacterium]|jgi:predicted aldo/keto reductase-like oxidoreductase|nr:aldo/keto reductase [Spirochaetaceae bacterium]
MQYRIDKKSGHSLSALGMGCMRFPKSGPRFAFSGSQSFGAIDYPKTEALVMGAIQSGVNYFDTAYIYPGSEETLGAILRRNNVRERVFIATKMPVIICKQPADFDTFFDKQRERLQTDSIDYYLMHMLTDFASWEKMKEFGIVEWAAAKKKSDAIRQFGFSFHGKRDEFCTILDDFDWDFCQIQYNYSDENYQAGVTGLKKAAAKGIPVIIMEPLLGGKLARNLPPPVASVFRDATPSSIPVSPADWALKWLWDQPEVTVVLSGMTTEADLTENLRCCEQSGVGSVTGAEREAYEKARAAFRASSKVPCTGCGYCMPCPRGVNIPSCFAAFNTSFAFGKIQGWQQYVTSNGLTSDTPSNAGRCVRCKKCESHCPQNIAVSDALSIVRKRMEPLWFRAGVNIARTFLGRKRF